MLFLALMKLKRLQNFLCYLQLETGGLIIAILVIAATVVSIIFYVAVIVLNAKDLLDEATLEDLGYHRYTTEMRENGENKIN